MLQDAFCSGANNKDGATRCRTHSGFPFPENVSKKGVSGRLAQLLKGILVEVVCVKFCKMAWHCGDVGVSAAQPPCLAE
ncbi:hypothetical protein NKI48_21320, partial [Mesorhizobium sp. M0644]|uniref:hypothetical protein n=1 Tax=Mesorhizobium sp. M0644 TaxID=2956979 RepID=UPI00333D81EC